MHTDRSSHPYRPKGETASQPVQQRQTIYRQYILAPTMLFHLALTHDKLDRILRQLRAGPSKWCFGHDGDTPSIPAWLFEHKTGRGRPVDLSVVSGRLLLHGKGTSRAIPLDSIRISRHNSGSTQLTLPDGNTCETQEGTILSDLLSAAETSSTSKASWRCRQVVLGIVLACALGITAVIGIMPRYASPILAQRIPATWIRVASELALARLDRECLAPSTLAPELQNRIRLGFAALRAPNGATPPYRLVFRDSKRLGAIAFALPGGDIIVTDQLVAASTGTNDLPALVSLELGHLKRGRALEAAIEKHFFTLLLSTIHDDATRGIDSLSEAFDDIRYRQADVVASIAFARNMLAANSMDSAHAPLAQSRFNNLRAYPVIPRMN